MNQRTLNFLLTLKPFWSFDQNADLIFAQNFDFDQNLDF